ncbi:hypothetical protein AURDEDRAFT_166078 [Auricularia subglabra TFB-10046 SS5]|nr:hypothetical protein AURDEDRAFT_166078 [Auricularia subglabra TFB-10046 SS5]
MAPRRSARSKAPAPPKQSASTLEAILYPAPTGKIPQLAELAPELFHEILSHLAVLPLSPNYNALPPGGIPYLCPFSERTETLRALSQTCRALRKCAHPLLWERLDCLLVPEMGRGIWYKYVMSKTQRLARGLAENPGLKPYVRTISLSVTKSQTDETLSALAELLPHLPALRTIQVVGCNQPGKLNAAIKGLSLDSVRVIAVDSDAHAFVRCCANVTHVRCTGASNPAILNALAGCESLERFDGMFNWSDPKNAQKLTKNAPNLKYLELRPLFSQGRSWQDEELVGKWRTTCLPEISKLKHLATLTLTFHTLSVIPPNLVERHAEQRKLYTTVLDDARKIMVMKRSVLGRRRLIHRYVTPPDYENSYLEDVVQEQTVEIFE